MKIAISAVEGSLDSQVDPRFGRAAWFLLIETETGELYETVDNSIGKEAAHGAGISAAALVADKGVQAVLTGRVGPKAVPVLEKANVQIINNIRGSIRDVVADFSGAAQPESSPETVQTDDTGRKCYGTGPGRGMGRGQGHGQSRR
ncbi:MAG: dinitrogenase iron-molybdenum cofactor biosynthesis protein [Desulfocapsa sp.]|nr:MAG: dinitrogenase iron-molybdenum cofactor biosynthesis protein [Desulfocapsa sp.]